MLNVEQVLEQILYDEKLPYDQFDLWLRNSQVGEIEEFARLSAQIWDWYWPYSRIYDVWFDHMDSILKSGYGPILLTLFKYLPEDEYFAGRIAEKLIWAQVPQALDVIKDLFQTLPYNVLWPYLIQELILSDLSPSMEHLSKAIEAVHQRNHPFSVLPLTLLSSETAVGYLHRRYYSWMHPVPDQNSRLSQLAPDAGVIWEETTSPELQVRLQKAFERWTYKSHGRIEARQFTAQQPLSAEMITQTRLLYDLNLDCLRGVTEAGIWSLSSQQVINTLLYAAANYSGYHGWLGVAYGRFAAWVSVGGLLNMPEETPITALNDAMDHTLWFEIDKKSGWFYKVLRWDEAIIALSPDRHILTILAATDTD